MSLQSQYSGHPDLRLYNMNSQHTQALKAIRDHVHHMCREHVNKLVQVETLDGDVFEGVLLSCEGGVLYLRLTENESMRGFFPGYFGSSILPLVLYELLVITLLI